jgi:hypothetical protein
LQHLPGCSPVTWRIDAYVGQGGIGAVEFDCRLSGNGGGSRRAIPISVLMLETMRKKASNRNEISDIELVFKPGVDFLPIEILTF